MRWMTFLILLYVMAALQAAKLGAFPSGPDAQHLHLWPEIMYLPMLAVFYALYAVDASAPLAAVACGLVYDVGNNEYFGTNMIPLALVAWVIVRIRLSIFRENMISQVIITLLAVLAFAVLSAVFRELVGAPLSGHSLWVQLADIAGDAVYTAVAAPIFFWVFFRFHHLLGFTSHGTRGRGHG